jgi:hypothetical protein
MARVTSTSAIKRLDQLWCANNGSLIELSALFGIPGFDGGGTFGVNESFITKVGALAEEIVPMFSGFVPASCTF